jgi:hypothetical protein
MQGTAFGLESGWALSSMQGSHGFQTKLLESAFTVLKAPQPAVCSRCSTARTAAVHPKVEHFARKAVVRGDHA